MIDFSSGYILRAIEKFPKQGSKAPWRLYQNYARDILSLGAPRSRTARCGSTATAPRFPRRPRPKTRRRLERRRGAAP